MGIIEAKQMVAALRNSENVDDMILAFEEMAAQERKGHAELTALCRSFGRSMRKRMAIRRCLPVVDRPLWPRGARNVLVIRVRWWHWFRRRRVREWRVWLADLSEYPGQFRLGFCL